MLYSHSAAMSMCHNRGLASHATVILWVNTLHFYSSSKLSNHSSSPNLPSGEERGETDVFAGYIFADFHKNICLFLAQFQDLNRCFFQMLLKLDDIHTETFFVYCRGRACFDQF